MRRSKRTSHTCWSKGLPIKTQTTRLRYKRQNIRLSSNIVSITEYKPKTLHSSSDDQL